MKNKKLRVLLVYHGAALDPSRKIFDALAAHKEIRLRVLGPRKGLNRMRNQVLEIKKPSHEEYDLVSGRVYKAMRDFSGPYLSGLIREILFFRPDVIHIFNEAYSAIHLQALLYRNILRPAAKCCCLGVENIIIREAKTRKGRFRRNFIHKHCDGAACWSASARDALREAGFPEEKLKITYWGVPLDRFFPSKNKALRLQLGIADKFVVGYVGRFQPEKGLWTLLLALRRLPAAVHALCVGDGYWRDNFLAMTEEFGLRNRVYWIPRVPDEQVADYINAMDVLVLPSETTSRWKEQFGRVLVEAMACAVPCIGSDSGAIPEILGAAGIIFAERDFVELAEAIARLEADPGLCQHMGSAGLERARKFFSCEAFADKLVSMYGQMIGCRQRSKDNEQIAEIPEPRPDSLNKTVGLL